MRRFPDFGRELRRPFAVHENCYDCAGFYEGCKVWPAAREFACGVYNPLPDVLPGTCGQRFPATSRQLTTLAEDKAKPDSLADASVAKRSATRKRDRHCTCGSPLPKGKRLCDLCRIQNKRQTKRNYMRSYMEQRRSAAVDAGSGMASTHAGTRRTQAGGSDLPQRGIPIGAPPVLQTSILTNHMLRSD